MKNKCLLQKKNKIAKSNENNLNLILTNSSSNFKDNILNYSKDNINLKCNQSIIESDEFKDSFIPENLCTLEVPEFKLDKVSINNCNDYSNELICKNNKIKRETFIDFNINKKNFDSLNLLLDIKTKTIVSKFSPKIILLNEEENSEELISFYDEINKIEKNNNFGDNSYLEDTLNLTTNKLIKNNFNDNISFNSKKTEELFKETKSVDKPNKFGFK